MSRLLDNLLIFGGVLRRAGIDVHAGRLAELAEALAYVDLGAQDEVAREGIAFDAIALAVDEPERPGVGVEDIPDESVVIGGRQEDAVAGIVVHQVVDVLVSLAMPIVARLRRRKALAREIL